MEKGLYLLAASSVVTLASLSLYHLLSRRKTKEINKCKLVESSQRTSISEPPTILGELGYNKENMSFDFACCASALMKTSDYDKRRKIMYLIQQASSFNQNFVVMRDSGCLDTLLGFLDADSDSPAAHRQNLTVLQIITNLACDQNCLPTFQPHIEQILKIADTKVYNDQSCAALQFLCNIALTPPGCVLLSDHIVSLCNMLEILDPYILRHLLAVLVNLSCDPSSCDIILNSEVPEKMMESIVYAFSSFVPPLVSNKMVNFLLNMYTYIGETRGVHYRNAELFSESGRRTMLNFFRVSRSHIKSCLLSLVSISDTGSDAYASARKLYDLLENAKSTNSV